jgi:hypothetical protein
MTSASDRTLFGEAGDGQIRLVFGVSHGGSRDDSAVRDRQVPPATRTWRHERASFLVVVLGDVAAAPRCAQLPSGIVKDARASPLNVVFFL